MFRNYHQSAEVIDLVDERQVEGLILLCKEMAGKSEIDKAALAALPLDKKVVREAVRRILNR